MKTIEVTPSWIQPGDHIITPTNIDMTVKYIDGPDKIGAYDIHGVDQKGTDQIVIVSDAVKLVR